MMAIAVHLATAELVLLLAGIVVLRLLAPASRAWAPALRLGAAQVVGTAAVAIELVGFSALAAG